VIGQFHFPPLAAARSYDTPMMSVVIVTAFPSADYIYDDARHPYW